MNDMNIVSDGAWFEGAKAGFYSILAWGPLINAEYSEVATLILCKVGRTGDIGVPRSTALSVRGNQVRCTSQRVVSINREKLHVYFVVTNAMACCDHACGWCYRDQELSGGADITHYQAGANATSSSFDDKYHDITRIPASHRDVLCFPRAYNIGVTIWKCSQQCVYSAKAAWITRCAFPFATVQFMQHELTTTAIWAEVASLGWCRFLPRNHSSILKSMFCTQLTFLVKFTWVCSYLTVEAKGFNHVFCRL